MNQHNLISGSHKQLHSGCWNVAGDWQAAKPCIFMPWFAGPTPPGYKYKMLHEERPLTGIQGSEDTAVVLKQFVEVP